MFANPSYITDGTVAMLCSVSLFLMPKTMHLGSTNCFGRGRRDDQTPALEYNLDGTVSTVLSWNAINRLNWDIIFLIGGGFALSKGFEVCCIPPLHL